jgi:cation diffusion facilitator family transporter
LSSIKERLQNPEASTKLSLVANVVLLILKIFGGFWGGSRALIADSLNSLLDLVANSAVWIGIRLAKKPADAEHQYGHGNADVIAASFVAIVILATGIFIGYDSIHVIVDHDYRVPSYFATAVAAFTIILKQILFVYTKKIGVRFKSPAVLANAQDHKSDVYASSGALFGIFFAQTGYPILDPIGGLWVSFFILRNAVNLIRDNIHTLMSGAPRKEFLDKVLASILEIDDVSGISGAKIRTLGAKLFVDLEITIDGEMTVKEGHEIAHKVRDLLLRRFDDIIEVMVHIEPTPEP